MEFGDDPRGDLEVGGGNRSVIGKDISPKRMERHGKTVYNYDVCTGLLQIDIDPKMLLSYLGNNNRKRGPYSVAITMDDTKMETFLRVDKIESVGEREYSVVGIRDLFDAPRKSYTKDAVARFLGTV